MLRGLLVLSLFACGSDPDPHVVGECVGWTDNLGNPFTGQCEVACKMPPADTGETCDTVKQLNCRLLDFDGTLGCCVPDSSTIRFYECQ